MSWTRSKEKIDRNSLERDFFGLKDLSNELLNRLVHNRFNRIVSENLR